MSQGQEGVAKFYKQKQIESATPAQLVVLLYDGAIDHLNKAETAFHRKDPQRIEAYHNHLIACQNIVTELTISLDMDKGGEIAQNLLRLYEYINHQLVDANLDKSLEPIQEARGLLGTLRDAWAEVAENHVESNPVPKSNIGLNLQG
jgi:flagellar protein FliS